jgi:hypothetical protein
MTASTAPLKWDTEISELILQAAREAVPKNVDSLITLPDVGKLNQPLMPLLVALIDAANVTAIAITDNAWDSGQAVPKELAAVLITELRACIQYVRQSTEAF